MAGDEFENLEDYERNFLTIMLGRLRLARDRGLIWGKLLPMVLVGRNWLQDDPINMPTMPSVEQVNAESIRPGMALSAKPGDDDTKERMERASARKVERHRQKDSTEEGTDEVPALSAMDEGRIQTDCAEAIRRMFAETEQRMTGGQVKNWLQSRGKHFGDSTIEHTLSDMANKTHELTKNKDARGKGYGLADW